MKNKILIIVAHPDDEVLGCGGIIGKYSTDNDIYVAIMGEGLTSRDNRTGTPLGLKKQAEQVKDILGIKKYFFFDFPDNKFDSMPLLQVIKKIESLIREIKPKIIYTHYIGDLNIDHRITCQACLTAARPINECSAKKIYFFEILSSTEWNMKNRFDPNCYENISSSLDKKKKAMSVYGGELRVFPHPRSLKGIEVLAQKRGMESGLEYAEAFKLVREIK